jgi:exonuclease SbcC
MNKIKRILIENFQSHENTVLDFADGLNVIVGPSDQGKSAVIRALKWVLYNEPRGIDFIRHGASMAHVTVELDNGSSITRERSKTKNRYIIASEGEEKIILEGFGNDVPEEVIKAHGMPKVLLDNDMSSCLNIGDQLEAPFLLSESGSVRAKAIGRLTGLHIIDKAIRDCNNDLRKETQNRDRLGKEMQEVDLSLEGYRQLDELEAAMAQTVVKINEARLKIERMGKIEKRASELEKINLEQENVIKIISNLQKISDCELAVKECETSSLKLSRLFRMYASLKAVETGIKEAAALMIRTENVDKCIIALERLNILWNRYNRLGKCKKTFEDTDVLLKKTKEFIGSTSGIDGADEIIRIIEHNVKIINRLDTIAGYLKEYEAEEAGFEAGLKLSALEPLSKDIIYIGEKQKLLEHLTDIYKRHQIITNYIEEGNKYLSARKSEIDTLMAEYASILRKLKICPLCQSEINEECLEKILKQYEEVN